MVIDFFCLILGIHAVATIRQWSHWRKPIVPIFTCRMFVVCFAHTWKTVSRVLRIFKWTEQTQRISIAFAIPCQRHTRVSLCSIFINLRCPIKFLFRSEQIYTQTITTAEAVIINSEALIGFSKFFHRYIKKLQESIKGKTPEELKSDENQIKITALKTTSNISTLIRDLFHSPPSFKSLVNLSWVVKATTTNNQQVSDLIFGRMIESRDGNIKCDNAKQNEALPMIF